MDWIAVGTLVAALVAAVAGVWAAMISQRQLTLTVRASDLPQPTVQANIQRVRGQPDWSVITLSLRNRADVSLDLLCITLEAPANTGILPSNDAFAPRSGPNGPRVLYDPLPAEKASRTITCAIRIGRAETESLVAGEMAYTTVYAHCDPSRFGLEPQPRLNLEMRWRDHTTKTFEMAVNIIKPNTA
nr:MAG TPA: hypothetical protein [Caudoviricetes sp.]